MAPSVSVLTAVLSFTLLKLTTLFCLAIYYRVSIPLKSRLFTLPPQSEACKWSRRGFFLFEKQEYQLAERCASFALHFRVFSPSARAQPLLCRALSRYNLGNSEIQSDINQVKKLDKKLAKVRRIYSRNSSTWWLRLKKCCTFVQSVFLLLWVYPRPRRCRCLDSERNLATCWKFDHPASFNSMIKRPLKTLLGTGNRFTLFREKNNRLAASV